MTKSNALFESELPQFQMLNRGKVRDIYDLNPEQLLIVTSDRLSAFDVVLPQPIPGKGEVLTRVANFWFHRTREIIPNHLTDTPLEQVIPDKEQRDILGDRALIVRKLKPLPVEAIVRGYLIGSGWKDYQRSGGVCGIDLPEGLRQADKLPEPIYTPSTKAEIGGHDENIDFEQTLDLLGREVAEQVRDASLRIYSECARYALERGIIIADTKFEFGLDENGQLFLIDEALTPDSSRFWPADEYWDKTPPGPILPQEVIDRTSEKYREAEERLTGG